MIDIQYIDDPRGGRVPMTDAFGNLTVDVMFLYNQNKLGKENKAAVDAVLEKDEMARDAMEGYALVNSDSEAKAIVSSLKKGFKSGVVEESVKPVVKLDIRKLMAVAAAILLIVVGTVVISQFVSKDQLAENIEDNKEQKNIAKEETIKKITSGFNMSDSVNNQIDEISTEVEIESEPMESEKPLNVSDVKTKDETNSANGNSISDTKRAAIAKDNSKNEEASKKKAELEVRLAQLRNQKSNFGNADSGMLDIDAEQMETVAMDKMVVTDAEPAREMVVPAMAEMKVEKETNRRSREKRSAAAAEQKEAEYLSVASKAEETQQNGNAMSADSSNDDASPIFFTTEEVDEVPHFPGGDLELFRFIEKRKIHPANLQAQGIGGEVFVSFQINSVGKVINVKPLRSDNSQMEADAIRVIRSMPNWEPAKVNGKAVAVKKTILIKYRIEE